MANNTKNPVQSFYRIVKAQSGHKFGGLYAVEKVTYVNGEFRDKQIVHEWDLRIISESILARLGGQDAYESFKYEKPDADLGLEDSVTETGARTAAELTAAEKKMVQGIKMLPKPPKDS